MTITTNPHHPNLNQPKDNGQNETYLVLNEEERNKGFIRPVRTSYRHIGPKNPKYPLRDLTEEEKQKHDGCGYVKYEKYPESRLPVTGRFWTQQQLDDANNYCGAVTHMDRIIAETYARNPNFYGATFCSKCGQHFRVEEFVWTDDETLVGS